MKIFFCLAVLVVLNKAYSYELKSHENEARAGDSKYDYQALGPDVWFLTWPQCAGSAQSPVNIIPDEVHHNANLKPFKFFNYENVTLEGYGGESNIGFGLDQDKFVGVSGSDFGDNKFEFINAHFHWGYNNYQGSEHEVDGYKFPLELHLVHLDENSNVAVLGFLFELSEMDNPDMKPLINSLENIQDGVGLKININLFDVFPKDLEDYYRYSGSFTTPPCTEGVAFNVFKTPIQISESQMQVFHEQVLKMNFRDPQRLNERRVYKSFHSESVSDLWLPEFFKDFLSLFV